MIVGKDATWQAWCSIEKSLHTLNGLFLNYRITIPSNPQLQESLDIRIRKITEIQETCVRAIGLEFV